MSDSDVALAERVADRFARLVAPGATCLIAVSGGPDSLALLDLLHALAGSRIAVERWSWGMSIMASTPRAPSWRSRLSRRRSSVRSRLWCRQLHLGAATSETRARSARRAALREMALRRSARRSSCSDITPTTRPKRSCFGCFGGAGRRDWRAWRRGMVAGCARCFSTPGEELAAHLARRGHWPRGTILRMPTLATSGHGCG
jgi:hypothetical protein